MATKKGNVAAFFSEINAAMTDENIGQGEKLLYVALLNAANKSFWASSITIPDAELCVQCGVSVNTLRSNRKGLAAAQYIAFESKNGASGTNYILLRLQENQNCDTQNSKKQGDTYAKIEQVRPDTYAKIAQVKNPTYAKIAQVKNPTYAKIAQVDETTPYISFSKDFSFFKTLELEREPQKKINEDEILKKNISSLGDKKNNQTKGGGAASFNFETKGLACPPHLQAAKFETAWANLTQMPNFRNRATVALQSILDGLGSYPLDFALELIRTAIMGEYRNVLYEDTPQKFERWQKTQKNVQKSPENATPKVAMVATAATVATAAVVKPDW